MFTPIIPSITFNPLRPIGLFSELDIITRSRQGVLRSEADRVAALVRLTDNEMAAALGLLASYLHRLQSSHRISQDVSERLSLLENLLEHALDTFEGRTSTILNWLRSPLRELEYQTPFIDTGYGHGLHLSGSGTRPH